MATESNEKKVQIFYRISSIPLVATTLIIANEIYGKIKNYNDVLNNALTKTELSIQLVSMATTKVTDKLEKPISIADNIACNGLDTLEKKVPSIKKTPNELGCDALKVLCRFQSYGASVLYLAITGTVKKIAIVNETPIMKAIRQRSLTTLDSIEKTIDDILPENAIEHQKVDRDFIVQRIWQLPIEVYSRLVRRCNTMIIRLNVNTNVLN
jgi:hypothetical protein